MIRYETPESNMYDARSWKHGGFSSYSIQNSGNTCTSKSLSEIDKRIKRSAEEFNKALEKEGFKVLYASIHRRSRKELGGYEKYHARIIQRNGLYFLMFREKIVYSNKNLESVVKWGKDHDYVDRDAMIADKAIKRTILPATTRKITTTSKPAQKPKLTPYNPKDNVTWVSSLTLAERFKNENQR